MSNMVPFVRVLNAFTKNCPYLDYANEMVNTLQKGMFNDSIPARIHATGVQGIGEGEDDNPLPQSASGPSDITRDLMMGAHHNHYGTKRDRDESSDTDVVPTDSARVNFELAVNSELSTPPTGRLQWVELTKTMIMGVLSSLLHQRVRVRSLQHECDEQTCR